MGAPSATQCANFCFGVFELELLPMFEQLVHWKHFVDNGVGMWQHDPCANTDKNAWESFKALLNSCRILTWKIEDRSKQVNHMDLTLTLQPTMTHAKLYKKAMNLCLYLTPHTAHPPGVTKGIMCSMFYHFF